MHANARQFTVVKVLASPKAVKEDYKHWLWLMMIQVILETKSSMAAVEIGGGPWFGTWKGDTSNTPELLKRALQVPLDLESTLGLVPFFKPPGL